VQRDQSSELGGLGAKTEGGRDPVSRNHLRASEYEDCNNRGGQKRAIHANGEESQTQRGALLVRKPAHRSPRNRRNYEGEAAYDCFEQVGEAERRDNERQRDEELGRARLASHVRPRLLLLKRLRQSGPSITE
jgi:hypothetical protein